MDFDKSKTKENLLAAFAGESMARNKYTYYAGEAKKSGHEKISEIFYLTAENERAHAKEWFKILEGIGNTSENLGVAAGGEHYEWSTMYKDFAKIAEEEGFTDIAKKFELVAGIEKMHEERFNAYKKQLDDGTLYDKSYITTYRCMNCGYETDGAEAPQVCPVCKHKQGFFESIKK